ncbi:MAG: zf-HC2 domain-containing protein [Planctomycetes bacterium]|nr:zf-HC2 domain-containing protein [Planctomycetota bacterium]
MSDGRPSDAGRTDPFGEGGDGTGVALTADEALELLPNYVSGTLPAHLSREIEAHIAHSPACAAELKRLRAEEDLLVEALSELRPDPTFRARVAATCEQVHRGAEQVANSLPENGWAAFRWTFACLSLAVFTAISLLLSPPSPSEELFDVGELPGQYLPLFWINVTLFMLSLFLLIGGRLVAALEAHFTGRGAEQLPSRLEVLTLETLGLCGVIATTVFHYLHWTG